MPRTSLLRATLLAPLLLGAPACLYGLPLTAVPTAASVQAQQQAAMAQSQAQTDAQYAQLLAQYRAAALAAPGSAPEAKGWAGMLEASYEYGTVARGAVDGPTQVREVSSALDAAAARQPGEAGELLAMKGRVQLRAGQQAEGVSSLRASLDAKPTTTALLPLLDALEAQGSRAEVVPLCQKTRAAITAEDERALLLESCLRHSGASSVREGLAWAGANDIAFYESLLQQREARAQAREQAWRDDAQRMTAQSQARQQESRSFQASGAASSDSGAVTSTSVTVISECSRTVRVFYGRKPKYGSGTESTVSGNSRSSAYRGPDGAFVMWLIDESGNGIASAEAGPSQREVVIQPSCTSLSTR